MQKKYLLRYLFDFIVNVLIDGCIAIGASDAGIYVGQSERIKVLNNIQEDNEEIKKYSIAAKNLE